MMQQTRSGVRSLLLVVAALSLLAACGGESPEDPAEAPAAEDPGETPVANDPGEDPSEAADAYALELSGGQREGCSSARPGRDSENHPGCIYGVAFAGCYEGKTGERLGPVPVEKEFPDEPGLQAIYHQAVRDCAE